MKNKEEKRIQELMRLAHSHLYPHSRPLKDNKKKIIPGKYVYFPVTTDTLEDLFRRLYKWFSVEK